MTDNGDCAVSVQVHTEGIFSQPETDGQSLNATYRNRSEAVVSEGSAPSDGTSAVATASGASKAVPAIEGTIENSKVANLDTTTATGMTPVEITAQPASTSSTSAEAARRLESVEAEESVHSAKPVNSVEPEKTPESHLESNQHQANTTISPNGGNFASNGSLDQVKNENYNPQITTPNGSLGTNSDAMSDTTCQTSHSVSPPAKTSASTPAMDASGIDLVSRAAAIDSMKAASNVPSTPAEADLATPTAEPEAVNIAKSASPGSPRESSGPSAFASNAPSPSVSSDPSDPSDPSHPSVASQKDERERVPIIARSGVPVCHNCLTSRTPLWRRDESGHIMCNACGLFLKLHGRRRPISLKTDVIKSRNRNRSSQNQAATQRKSSSSSRKRVSSPHPPGLSQLQAIAANPDHSPSSQLLNQSQASQTSQIPSVSQIPQPSQTPQVSQVPQVPPQAVHMVPVAGMPNVVYPSSPALAPFTPQTHVLPTPLGPPVQLASQSRVLGNADEKKIFTPHSPQIRGRPDSPPQVRLVRGPMSEQLLPRSPPGGLERIPPLSDLQRGAVPLQVTSQVTGQVPAQQASSVAGQIRPLNSEYTQQSQQQELSTKVSELELVNDLLRRRIADLEYAEIQARKVAVESQATARALWEQLDQLKRQFAQVQSQAQAQAQVRAQTQPSPTPPVSVQPAQPAQPVQSAQAIQPAQPAQQVLAVQPAQPEANGSLVDQSSLPRYKSPSQDAETSQGSKRIRVSELM